METCDPALFHSGDLQQAAASAVFRYVQNYGSGMSRGRQGRIFPIRLRTDFVPLDRNFSGATFSAPSTISRLESDSRVPWWRMHPSFSRWAVPETLRPSTRMSLRPEDSASSPRPFNTRTTGSIKRLVVICSVFSSSVIKE